MKNVIFAALLISLFFSVSYADTVTTREGGVVNVRKKAGASSAKIGTVNGGEEFELIEIGRNGWLHIKYDGGDGWISSKLATINSTSESGSETTTNEDETDSSNAPSTESVETESMEAGTSGFGNMTAVDGSITFSGIPWGTSMQGVQNQFGQAEAETCDLYDSTVAWVTRSSDAGIAEGTSLLYYGQGDSGYDTATFYFDGGALTAVMVSYQPTQHYGNTLDELNASMITALTDAFGKPKVTTESAFGGKTVEFYRWTGDDQSTVQMEIEQYGMFLEVLYASPRLAPQ